MDDLVLVYEDQLQPFEVNELAIHVCFEFFLDIIGVGFGGGLLDGAFVLLRYTLLFLLFTTLVQHFHRVLELGDGVFVLAHVVDPAPDRSDLLEVGANHLVVGEEALLATAVLEGEHAHALLLVVDPLALVDGAV